MPKEDEILNAIKEFYIANGYPPTIRELCGIVNLKSTSSVAWYMEKLKARGDIIFIGKSYTVRGIKVSFDD